jgi:hypothetical protein
MLSRLGFSTLSVHTVVLYRGSRSQALGVGCVAKILVWDWCIIFVTPILFVRSECTGAVG